MTLEGPSELFRRLWKYDYGVAHANRSDGADHKQTQPWAAIREAIQKLGENHFAGHQSCSESSRNMAMAFACRSDLGGRSNNSCPQSPPLIHHPPRFRKCSDRHSLTIRQGAVSKRFGDLSGYSGEFLRNGAFLLRRTDGRDGPAMLMRVR
jgi:hypothetical protein